MRCAVLASPDSWYLRDLRRAAGERHRVDCIAFDRISTTLDGVRHSLQATLDDAPERRPPKVDWNAYDAVLVRTMPPGSLEQVVFRMDALGRYEQQGGVVVNPPRAVEAAVDKYLTSARLQAAGLETPRTWVGQHPDDALEAFHALGGDVVVKPLFGSEGRGIIRVADPDLAVRVFKTIAQLNAVLYLQEFVDHLGHDIRLLVIGDETYGMRRHNPLDWRTNVSRGAVGEAFTPNDQLIEMARRAAASVGAPVAGVDLLPTRDGRLLAIEVNAVPGWKALAQAVDVDIAARVWRFVEAAVERRSGVAHVG
ncbi:MAG: RimK family alpha-L-glutamate ligase [Pirellulales bacterium]